MWSSLKVLSKNLLRVPIQYSQPQRTTYIFKRKHDVRLSRLSLPLTKRLKRRNFYYELVEDTDETEKPPLALVLNSDVPGIGMRGERVELDPYVAYRDLLLPKLAFYANSPEAENIIKTVVETKYSSKYSKIVENYLADQAVEIILSHDLKWTLKPWHVKLALRKIGVVAEEHCINIPKEISGPNLDIENKDFVIYLKMNKSEVFPIRCRIYHWSTEDPNLNQKFMDINSPSECLFPDEKETVVALLKTQEEIRRNRMIKAATAEPEKEIKKPERKSRKGKKSKK